MSKKQVPYESIPGKKWMDPILGILFFIILVSIGLALALFFRPLYYWSIDWLDIEKHSGLSADIIKENYNALIDYCSPFFKDTLRFPSLPASASGISHFAEVKVIFNAIFTAGFVSTLIFVPAAIYKLYYRDKKFLRSCAITSIIVPSLLLILCMINFDWLFIVFHKVVFNNDDWLFDPNLDPVIKILPENFFMECAIVIALVVIIGALSAFIAYKKIGNYKPKDEDLIPRKKNYIY